VTIDNKTSYFMRFKFYQIAWRQTEVKVVNFVTLCRFPLAKQV